ncbi:hypothetical protein [Leptolyngbya ohadii]|uniref:hypothetical protein n=1 Tax=Leptolyngbya ohadii TaxID=1962290 RepID=UPI000B59FD37|nr:hypothetical protein [Leptolyngbya ohadii]
MDESQNEFSNSASVASDDVLLSDRALDVDPTQVLIESSDPNKMRFRLIEWLVLGGTSKPTN